MKQPEMHVLIVDDDSTIRHAITTLLQVRGYLVAAAVNGRRALDYLQAGPHPHIILLDMVMPEMDGREFLLERQKDPRLAAIPVVVFSSGELTSAEVVALGATGFLPKPFEFARLLEAIRAALV